MSDPNMLGSRLKEAREALGLSVEDVADRMTVNAKTVGSWENGESVPRPNRLHILSGMLGVPFGSLFAAEEVQPGPTDLTRRIERLENRLEQMNELQAKLRRLSDQLAEEITEIRKIGDRIEDRAA